MAELGFKPRIFTSLIRVFYLQHAITWNSRDSHKIPSFAPIFLSKITKYCQFYCGIASYINSFPEMTYVIMPKIHPVLSDLKKPS